MPPRTALYAEPTELDTLLPESSSSNDENRPADTPSTTQATPKSTGQAILDLAIPAAGALLIDPLMTLADTAFVGHYSTDAFPLAGMGSAAALLTFSFYLFNFLCTATTPLVGSKRAAGQTQEAATIAGQSLSLALVLGVTLATLLLTLDQPLLLAMGTSITGTEANRYALQFLTVRALAAPAVLCIEASTGVLRGYLDTQTPIVILVAANLVNLVLDVVLIAYAGMGPMGAAIATTTAEWISAGAFLAVLAGKLTLAPQSPWTAQLAQPNAATITPTLTIPSWTSVRPLIVASSSVFVRALVLQASLALAAAIAARGGAAAASVAAHQIGIQLWLVSSFFCDSLAAASQGLVADAMGQQDSTAIRNVSRTVFQYSTVLGVALAVLLQVGASSGVVYAMFGSNVPATQDALSHILPLIILAQPLNALVFAADGVLQGASEFPFQAKAMLVSGVSAVATFAVLQADTSTDTTLVHVWMALLVLQLVRGLTSLYKLIDPKGPIDLLAR
jgi:putative MATE family efflux protein